MLRRYRHLLSPMHAVFAEKKTRPAPLTVRPALVALEDRSVPATFTVANLNDSGADSLRAALDAANLTAEADTVIFQAGLTGTISLATQLSITNPVTVTGPGAASLTLDSVEAAGAAARVLNIDVVTAGQAVALSGVTLTGGNVTGTALANRGGAILNTDAVLALTGVVVSGNTAVAEGPAIHLANSTAGLTLTDSKVSGNSGTGAASDGGGVSVRAASTVTILRSTISGNTVGDDGGGIDFFNGGTLNLTDSTVSGNTGGGDGGGVYVFSGTTTITNSTISGNTGGRGGAVAILGTNTATIQNSTITLNAAAGTGTNASGGITRTGTASTTTLVSTVVAGNTGGVANGADVSLAGNTLTANNSLVGVADGVTITGSANLTGTAAAPLNPLLTGLQANGGPTATHGLLTGSPALNAGSNPLGLTTDQRGAGFPRVVGSQADIGAFEGVVTLPTAALGTAANVTTAGGTSYTFTVVYAATSPALVNVSTIGTDDVTVTGPGGALTPVTFVGAAPNANAATVTATFSVVPPGGTFNNSDNGTYTIAQVAGAVADTTGAVTAASALGSFQVAVPLPTAAVGTAANVTTPGATTYSFTVVYTAPTGALIDVSTIGTDDVTVTGPGGALTPVTFVGAAPNANAATVTATFSVVPPGGAFDPADGGVYTIAAVAGSVADTSGGAVAAGAIGTFSVAIPISVQVTNLNDAGAGSLRQALLDTNANFGPDTVTFQAGLTGTITLAAELPITSPVTVTGPGAAALTVSGAGAVRVLNVNSTTVNAAVNISGLTITAGSVAGDGAGVLVANDDYLNLNGVVVSNSAATGAGGQGGGIYLGGGGLLQLVNSTVSGNTAGEDGGGVYFFSGGALNVVNSTISGNTSLGTTAAFAAGGGGLYFFGAASTAATLPAGFTPGVVTVTNSTISGNTSASNGGGIVAPAFVGTLLIRNSTVTLNAANGAAGTGGGGLRVPGGTLTLQNTVVDGNTTASTGTPNGDVSFAGAALNANFSFVGDQTGLTFSGTSGNNLSGDAGLPALASNGGPTLTHAITTGSVLYNAGSAALVPAGVTTDQRGAGFTRTFAGATDIGAFEFSLPNTLPAITAPTTAATAEDTAVAIAGVSVADPDAGATVTVTLTATNGTLAATGTGVTGSGTGTVTVAGTPAAVTTALGTLAFTPAANFFGTATVTVNAVDENSGNAVPKTVTVAVTAVADTPAVTGATTAEDTQTTAGLVVTRNAADGAEVGFFKITNILNGTLFLNDGTTPVAGGSFITFAQANAGLRFTPAANFSGTGSFGVQASTANGDAGLGGAVVTATITVTAVNDAPTLADPADASASVGQTVTVNLAGISAGPANEAGQALTVTAVSSNPAVVANPAVTYTSPNSTGSLSLTGLAIGTATVTVTVTDDNGTPGNAADDVPFSQTFTVTVVANQAPANTVPGPVTTNEDTGVALAGVSVLDPDGTPGTLTTVVSVPVGTLTGTGVVGSGTGTVTVTGTAAVVNAALATLAYAPPPNANSATLGGAVAVTVTTTDALGAADTDTVLVTVTPINDAPTFALAGSPPAVSEDAAAQTVPGFATAIAAGPAGATDEAAQALTFTVTTNSNPGLFLVGPAVAADGTLTYTLAPDAFGTATVTVVLTDGGTPAASSAAQTFTVTALSVNDAPAVADDAPAGPFAEDAAATFALADLLGNDAAGPANESAQTLTLTAVGGAVGGTVAIVNGAVVFTPAANFNGSASFTYTVTDDGTTNGAADPLTATATVTFTITPVNDAPTFAIGASPSVAEDAGAQTVPGFASFITPGPADESAQTVQFTVTTDNPGLFSVLPAVSADGTLTYTLAPNGFGTAQVTLVLADSAGGASAPQSRTVFVAGVNDAPVAAADALAGPFAEDGAVTLPSAALTANDSAGPNEAAQTLTVTGVSNPVGGTVAIVNGAVVFTPTPDYTGPASFTYTVTDDGTTGGAGAPLTATATVTFTITPVNDAPTLDAVSPATAAEDAGAQTVALTGITAGGGESQALTVTAVSDNPLLTGVPTVTYATPGAAGTLTFTPAPNAAGTATITVTVTDAAGATKARAFTVTVTPVNDPPAAANDSFTVPRGVTSPLGVLANDTASPDAGETLTITAVTQPANGTVAVTGGGAGLTFTPAAGFGGVTTFTYTVGDGNGGTATATVTVTVPPDTTAPTVAGVALVGPAATSAATVTFTVTFSEVVTGVDASDFTLTAPGLTGTSVVSVTGSGSTYTVTAATGAGSGTLALNVIVDGSLGDTAGNRLAAGATGPAVTVTNATPVPPVPPTPPVPPAPAGQDRDQNEVGQFAVGTGPNGAGVATVYNADGSVAFSVTPFGATGSVTGVRVVVADATGDDTPDLVTGTGPGARAEVVIISGATRQTVRTLRPFEDGFAGGVQVAAADVNGDGVADVAVSSDTGGSGRVTVYDGANGGLLADFFGIDDPNFRGGARVSFGDVNGDGVPDLAVAAGVGGGPRVALYDGASVRPGQTPRKLAGDFFVFEETLRNGVYVALGDLDGDGKAELVAGGGPGGGPRVLALDGASLLNPGRPVLVQEANFFAADDKARQGVSVAAKDIDGDNLADLVVAAPVGAGAVTKVYLGRNIPDNGTPSAARDFDSLGGVFVG